MQTTRLRLISKLRGPSAGLLEPDPVFDESSPLLSFALRPGTRWGAGLASTVLYRRKETGVLVLLLQGRAASAVVKFYPAPRLEPGGGFLSRADVEIRYLRLLAEYVRLGATPHVALPIGRAVVSQEQARELGMACARGPHVLIAAEAAHSSLTKELQLRSLSPHDLKCVLLQMMYTLQCIQSDFPSFRHNDLHCSNVLLRVLPAAATVEYVIHGVSFFTRTRYVGLLWDMYYASIADARAGRPERCAAPNKYTDVHRLFDSVQYVVAGHRHYSEFLEMVDTVVPEPLKCLPRQRKVAEVMEWMEPAEVLSLPYFRALLRRREKPARSYERVSLFREEGKEKKKKKKEEKKKKERKKEKEDNVVPKEED